MRERENFGCQHLRDRPNSTSWWCVSIAFTNFDCSLCVPQETSFKRWFVLRPPCYDLTNAFFGQDHCILEDDASLIALGISGLGDETTIKIWVSEVENTNHTLATPDDRAKDANLYKVVIGPFLLLRS